MTRVDSVRHENEILLALLRKGPLSTSELVEETKLHRDTIYVCCRSLIEKGVLKEKQGKFEKYYLRIDVYENPAYIGFNFNLNSRNYANIQPRFIVGKGIRMPIKKVLKDRNQDNYELIAFANSIASKIVYVLMQAISPLAWRKYDRTKIGIDKILGKSYDSAVKEFVMHSINPWEILIEFSKLNLVRRGRATGTLTTQGLIEYLKDKSHLTGLPERERKQQEIKNRKELRIVRKFEKEHKNKQYDPTNPEWSSFKMDEKNHKRLIKCYKQLWPELFDFFEMVMQKTRQDIENSKLKKLTQE